MLIFFFLSCHHVAVYLSTGEEDSMVPKQWVEHTRDRLGQSAIIITYRGSGAQAVGGAHQGQARSVRISSTYRGFVGGGGEALG